MIEKKYVIIIQNIPIRIMNGKGTSVEYLRYDFFVDKDYIYNFRGDSSAINYLKTN
jgi:hypothetical protein